MQAVEPFVALVFLTPLTGKKALRSQAAEQRVEGALINQQAVIGRSLRRV